MDFAGDVQIVAKHSEALEARPLQRLTYCLPETTLAG